MRTVEFEAKVNNGVHVILQVDDPQRGKDFIDELLERPKKVPWFRPLSRNASHNGDA